MERPGGNAPRTDGARLKATLERAWFPVGFLLLAAACTADSEHPRSGHSMAGDWWELSQVPSVVLGDESADGSPLLYRIREGTVLPSGNIVLTQPQEVLRYARNGDFEGYIGREGKGPGEFLITTAMSRLSGSDHIRIMDLLNRRVTTMTSQGEVLATWPLEGRGLPFGSRIVGQPDGSFIGYGWKSWLDRHQGPPVRNRAGARVDSVLVLRLTDSAVDTVSLWEGGVRVTARAGNMNLTRTPPLGRRLVTAIGPGIIAHGYNDDGEFHLIGLDGVESNVVRMLAERREITDRERSEAERDFLSRYGRNPLSGEDQESLLQEIIQDAPKPRFLPMVDDAVFDSERNLWLRVFEPDPDEEVVWEVHSEEGVFLARVLLPFDLEILEIGRTYLLGLQKDSLDVETVKKFELIKG